MSERTREPDRMAPERERRTSVPKSQAAGKKVLSGGQAVKKKMSSGEQGVRKKVSSEDQAVKKSALSEEQAVRKMASSEDPPVKKRVSSGGQEMERKTSSGQSTRGTAKKKKPAETGDRRVSSARKPGSSSRQSAKSSPGRSNYPSERSRMEDDGRMSSRELERARRREERLKRVRRQKIIMAVSGAVIVLSLLTLLIFFLSPARCIVSLSKGDKYARNEEYDKALTAYQEALEINENSVRAYRGIAGCLRMKGQLEEAKQILSAGWEKTEDKGILQYYNKLLINESVEEINAGNCSQATADRLNEVLRSDPENLDALKLLDTCNQMLSGEEAQWTGEEQ